MTTDPSEVLFDCDYCEGDVVLSTGSGRLVEYRSNIAVELPEHFLTATCQKCGQVYLTSAEAEALEPLLAGKVAEVAIPADAQSDRAK